MGVVLLIVVLLFVFGGYPGWGWHQYGYAPMGVGGVLLLILLVLLISGRL